jgi:hypothetical protein
MKSSTISSSPVTWEVFSLDLSIPIPFFNWEKPWNYGCGCLRFETSWQMEKMVLGRSQNVRILVSVESVGSLFLILKSRLLRDHGWMIFPVHCPPRGPHCPHCPTLAPDGLPMGIKKTQLGDHEILGCSSQVENHKGNLITVCLILRVKIISMCMYIYILCICIYIYTSLYTYPNTASRKITWEHIYRLMIWIPDWTFIGFDRGSHAA